MTLLTQNFVDIIETLEASSSDTASLFYAHKV